MTATRLLVLLPTILLLAGCGGSSSSHSSSTGAGIGPRTAPASTAGAPKSSSARGAGSSSRGASGPSGGVVVPRPGGSGGGAIDARVPADFHLTLDGRLRPATISIPAFLAVALSVTSGDARPHTVLVRTPSPHTLSVPSHGHASLLIAGLKAGNYAVQVDGRARAALLIGGEPGP
ncbi:MAG: hypothetical protein M3Z27_02050 [Actinomycetota bacterium]|nr:hypothetical protein [Actinomycetota bacterium]